MQAERITILRFCWYRKKKKKGKGKNANSPAGNRTPVSRVTGGDTHHYTTEDRQKNVTYFEESKFLNSVLQL